MASELPVALFREDLHDAAHRIASVEAALGTANDLDALDVVGGEMRQERDPAWGRGIVEFDAVEQHENVVGVTAANEDRCVGAGSAVASDVDAGNAHLLMLREYVAAIFRTPLSTGQRRPTQFDD